MNFEKLTIENGLSQGFIYNIAQDKKGFMWFCTPDGLNRYDGYHFKVYRHDETDSFSIASNLVTKFFVDTHGKTWIATTDNGLDYFDIPYQRFYHFLNGMPVDDITEDKYGNLLVASRNRIIVTKISTQGSKHKKCLMDTTSFTVPAAVVNSHELIGYRLFTDDSKNMYISSRRGIFKLVYNADKNITGITKLYTFPQKEMIVPAVLEDKTTHKFYACLQGFLFEFADNNFARASRITPAANTAAIFIDSKQRIWYGDINSTHIFNLKTSTTTHIVAGSKNIQNMLMAAYAAFEDKNGNVWLGTSGLGVLKYTEDLNAFHHMLPNQYIYNLQRYDQQSVLVEGKLKITFNQNNLVIDTVNLPGLIKEQYNPVIKYVIDSNHNYWFLHGDTLQRYNPFTKTLHAFAISDKLRSAPGTFSNAKEPDKPAFLFQDKQQHLWFQCYGKMMRYNIAADSITVLASLPVFKDEDRSFQVMYEDANGTLWITGSRNFYSYNSTTGKINFFNHEPGNPAAVASSNISCFCDDPLQAAQYIWIGTRGSGISKMNKATGECTSLNVKNGLPNNVIYSLLNDEQGNIWGSTNKGLFRLNVKTGSIKNFDVTDGLQGNEFNRFAYLKLDNGILIFGGLNGINYFRPKQIHALAPPTVQLTNIKLLNQYLSVNDSNALIDADVSYLQQLAIKSNQNVINFEFAALDFKKTGAVYYRYKLDGFDKAWNDAGLANTATYTNLDPGNYTLFVQASNDNINWQPNKLLALQVLPMWWQTWLFKLLVAFCIVAAGYFIYRYRVLQLLKIERVRNNIAKDLHDEIGSTLSSISIYSKVAQKNKTANPENLLKKISDNADQVLDSMNDIVWSINARNDAFENIFFRMREHAVQLLETKEYAVHFDFDEKLNHVKFDMQRRRDFYLIYKEALNNIAKYAGGNNVWISLSLNNDMIVLNIRDDGKGFALDKKVKSGNGLNNMQKRAETLGAWLNITSDENKGTNLHLSLPQHA